MPTLTINNFADLKVGDVALFQLDDGNDITGVVKEINRGIHSGTARINVGKRQPSAVWLPSNAFHSATREVPWPEPKFRPGMRVEELATKGRVGTVMSYPADAHPSATAPYILWDGLKSAYFFNGEKYLREIPGFSVGDKVVVRAGAKMNSGPDWSITEDRTGIVIPWVDPDWPRRNGENHVYIQLTGQRYGTIFKYEDVSPAVSGSTEVIGSTDDRRILLVGSVSDLRSGDIVVGGPIGKPAAATISRAVEQ